MRLIDRGNDRRRLRGFCGRSGVLLALAWRGVALLFFHNRSFRDVSKLLVFFYRSRSDRLRLLIHLLNWFFLEVRN